MLVVPDKRWLGDAKLNKVEAVIRKTEDTNKFLKRFQLPDHEHRKNQEECTGQVMASADLVKKVLKLNPNLIVLGPPTPYSPIGMAFHWGRDQKYIAGFEQGFLPEFSYTINDERDLPAKFVRGWREVLYRLLKDGALTFRQVLHVFGDAHHCASDLAWRKFVRQFR